MMQCLDRDLRIAFILGSVLKIKSNVASTILNITSVNFRKRVELSRRLIGAFLEKNCGVYNPYNTCRCNNKIKAGLQCGRINRTNLNFADKMDEYISEMDEIIATKQIINDN